MRQFCMRLSAFIAPAFALLLPLAASAHEVYVLDPATVLLDVANPSPNPLWLAMADFSHFSLWALIGVVTVGGIFLLSITRSFETFCAPFLHSIKHWAAPVARLTLGFSLLFSAYNDALFGPELPLEALTNHHALFAQAILYGAGFLILIGFLTRSAAIAGMLLYASAVSVYGVYMLTYINYFGELLVVFLLGSGALSIDSYRGIEGAKNIRLRKLLRRLEPYAFPALRICFGIAVMYASWYAKFVHSQLALDTVVRYHLTDFFHFEPLFIVLGAFIIETLIGLFFILGFEVRFTALFFLTFLGLSLWYFGELVWPHIILIGVNLALLLHGYDRFSLEGRFFETKTREPVF